MLNLVTFGIFDWVMREGDILLIEVILHRSQETL